MKHYVPQQRKILVLRRSLDTISIMYKVKAFIETRLPGTFRRIENLNEQISVIHYCNKQLCFLLSNKFYIVFT